MATIKLKKMVKNFEKDQQSYGTETAIYNLLWLTASDILDSIGVKSIKTSDGATKRKKR